MAEDRKFAFDHKTGQFINRVSGEAIPHDEPVIIFRARDRNALQVLNLYLQLCEDDHHKQAIRDRIEEFSDYITFHPDRVKEPGITHAIKLNRELR